MAARAENITGHKLFFRDATQLDISIRSPLPRPQKGLAQTPLLSKLKFRKSSQYSLRDRGRNYFKIGYYISKNTSLFLFAFFLIFKF